MSNSPFSAAVQLLVRRLRQYCLPSGHPPAASCWMFACSKQDYDRNPLMRQEKSTFGWLVTDPNGDAPLSLCIQNLEPVRRTSTALVRVHGFVERREVPAHFVPL
jgi:hypothetical protein